jgi:hypothetical protein
MFDEDQEDDYNEEPNYHSYGYNMPEQRYDWDDYDAEEE